MCSINATTLTLHHAFLFPERDLLIDNSSGTFDGNFLEVVNCSFLWTLQPRSYNVIRNSGKISDIHFNHETDAQCEVTQRYIEK